MWEPNIIDVLKPILKHIFLDILKYTVVIKHDRLFFLNNFMIIYSIFAYLSNIQVFDFVLMSFLSKNIRDVEFQNCIIVLLLYCEIDE